MADLDLSHPHEPAEKEQATDNTSNDNALPNTPKEFKHTWRIWCIFIALALLAFLSSIDSTIITTSLPTITREIHGSNQYVWLANSYLFASTVPQPLYGQVANIFGRRNPLFVAIALFFIGSGIAGGAHNVATLIAARTIQGLGTGGLYVLPEIILCDIIPPRYRGPFLSAILSSAALGTTIGPIIGGAFARVNWRWIFLLNLPVLGVLSFVLVFLLRVKYQRSATWRAALARVDFIGQAIFIPSMVSIFFGLIVGGTAGFPWNSWRVILPIVLGGLGWIAFHFYQASPFCKEPSTPPRLFKHRTSSAGFLMIFLAGIVLQAISYFLPIYFQAVKGASPLLSGVYYLPFSIALVPLAGFAGAVLSKTGRYRPIHFAGFALSAIGLGLLSTLDENSSTGKWIGFQIIAAGGSGFIFTVTLPSTLAALDEADVAVAAGTYSFIRSFGLVWGVTISSIAFNGQINAHLNTISDQSIRQLLADGAAYTYAAGDGNGSSGAIAALPEPTRSQVIQVYVGALRSVWLVFVGISGAGVLTAFIEKHVELRKNNDSQFGLADKESDSIESKYYWKGRNSIIRE
ncbi:major facilitator superfamily domain-containing protein [Xylaria sp. FL1777]|nr:major facilitator superfamily domain-containing protein [Xylaria sp. FL1777]